jgi:DNA invertase Pin-like site-specific DNA recombinase
MADHTPTTAPTPVRVALYVRCSTLDQDTDLQARELRVYAEKRGWVIVDEYTDKGVSGAKARRPSLDQLMAGARRREFDTVAVWRFDRFARSVRHLLTALDEFNALGVSFVSLRESIDFGTPLGRAMFTIVGAMAELEREIIRERVCAGVAKARAKGRRLGRPQRWNTAQITKAENLRAAGKSWREIAMTVGLPVRTVRRAVAVVAKSPTA